MKTKIKKIIMPMLIAIIAIASAFANNQSHQDDSALVDKIGFIRVGMECTSTPIVCSTIPNPFVCSDGINPILYDWNGTGCPLNLYRKIF